MSTPTASSDAAVQLSATDPPAMVKAKTPVSAGRIAALGILLALCTAVIGVIGVREALISANILTARSWIASAIDALDGLKPQWWAVPVGILIILLGIWILSVALRPCPRTAVALRSQTGVFLRSRDVKKIAARAADDVDGVMSTHVTATRRATTMTVTVTGDDMRISRDVQDAVAECLAALDPPPRLKIKVKPGVAP